MGGLFVGLGFLTALVTWEYRLSLVDKNAKPFRYLGGLGILTLPHKSNIALPSQEISVIAYDSFCDDSLGDLV